MDANDYISGLKEGNRKVISEIYEKNLHQLSNWIQKNNGTEDDALDIFQEGIETIINKIFTNTLPQKLNFGAYLFTICKNKWLDRLKEKTKDEKVRKEQLERYNDVGETVHSLDDDQNNILRLMLNDTFQMLSPTCQKLVSLLESGLSPVEVAVEMKMTNANTVYRRKFACYDSWKKKLQAHQNYDVWKY